MDLSFPKLGNKIYVHRLKYWSRIAPLYVMRCAIWYYLYNLKNMKNTHGRVLLLAHVFWRFLNFTNGTKSRNVSHILVTWFSLYSICIILDHKSHWIYPNENQTHNKLYFFLELKLGIQKRRLLSHTVCRGNLWYSHANYIIL